MNTIYYQKIYNTQQNHSSAKPDNVINVMRTDSELNRELEWESVIEQYHN